MPNARPKQGFNLNTYKIMKKVGYDFNHLVVLGKVVEMETFGLNKM